MNKPKLTKFGTEMRELYTKHIDAGVSPRLLGLEMLAAATSVLDMNPLTRAIVHGLCVGQAKQGGAPTPEEIAYMDGVGVEVTVSEVRTEDAPPQAKKGAALN